jgi:hypothetical protein
MASITTRQTGTTGVGGVTRKNAPLTNSEIDQNFININNGLESKAPTNNPAFTGDITVQNNNTVQWSSGAALQGTSSGLGMFAPGSGGGSINCSTNGWVGINKLFLQQNGEVRRTTYESNASGIVDYSLYDTSSVYMRSPVSNWTINFTAILSEVMGYTHTFEVFVEQGATPYLPIAVQIAGSPRTINWLTGQPVGTPNAIDHIVFKILYDFPNGQFSVAAIQNKPVDLSSINTQLASKAPISSPFLSNTTLTGLTEIQQTTEIVNLKTNATGTVNHDLNEGSIWSHTNISSNFTANFINVPTKNDRTISVVLILTQGQIPFICNNLQINNSSQTIRWQNNILPSGSANPARDVISFTLIRTGSSWTVLGSLNTFG